MNDWRGFLPQEMSKGLIYYIHLDQDDVHVANKWTTNEGFLRLLTRRKWIYFICTTLIAEENNIRTYIYVCILL